MCMNALYKYPDVCRDKKYNMSDSGGLQLAKCKKETRQVNITCFYIFFRALQKYITRFKDCVSKFFFLRLKEKRCPMTLKRPDKLW